MKYYFIRYRCNDAVDFSRIIQAHNPEEALKLYKQQDYVVADRGVLMEIYVIE